MEKYCFWRKREILHCCSVAVCFIIQDWVSSWSFDIFKDLPLWSTCFHTRTDISAFFLTLSYYLLSQPFTFGNSAFPTFMLMNLYVASFHETPQLTSSIKTFLGPLNHSWRSVSAMVLTGNAEWYQLVKRAGRVELFGYCKFIFLGVFALPSSSDCYICLLQPSSAKFCAFSGKDYLAVYLPCS